MTYVSCFYHAFSGAQKVSSSCFRVTLTPNYRNHSRVSISQSWVVVNATVSGSGRYFQIRTMMETLD